MITPGQAKLGIMPGHIHLPGHIGVVSKSGTLTYEAVGQLTALGLGQSTAVGVGGDPIAGDGLHRRAPALQGRTQNTHGVVLIGEIGGGAEERAAAWIAANFDKPVAGFIAGTTAPPGKRMGHAGAVDQRRNRDRGREDRSAHPGGRRGRAHPLGHGHDDSVAPRLSLAHSQTSTPLRVTVAVAAPVKSTRVIVAPLVVACVNQPGVVVLMNTNGVAVPPPLAVAPFKVMMVATPALSVKVILEPLVETELT